MSIIHLENVIKSYFIGEREVPVLKGIDLDIRQGEFVAIMGPSGSGKSTLLHLIGTLDKPTSGLVSIAGHDISNLSDQEIAVLRNKTIGFIFQSFHLLGYYTALENVNLPLVYGDEDSPGQSRGLALLEHVGLKDRVHHKPNELSGGERQRVAIARALINNPKILFADEPTGNLDSKSGTVVMEYLKNIHAAGTTVVVITHDPHVAEQAERTIHIQDGMIV